MKIALNVTNEVIISLTDTNGMTITLQETNDVKMFQEMV